MLSSDLFFLFYLTHIFVVKVQELACTVRYGINKTLIPKTSNKRNQRLQSPNHGHIRPRTTDGDHSCKERNI